MKPTLFIPLFLLGPVVFAQLEPPEAFVSFGGFFEEQLESSAYLNISAGIEPFSYKFIAPDMDATLYFGGDEGRTFTAWVWGVAPKLFLMDDPHRLVFIPKYHFGNQKATESLAGIDGTEIDLEAKARFNFWSFSVGYEIVSEEVVGKIGIYLTYTGFDAGKTLNQLEALGEDGTSPTNYVTRAIGLTVRLSNGFRSRNR